MIRTDEQTSSNSGERACTLTAGAIADKLRGELRGDKETIVSGVAPLDRATPKDVSFVSSGRYAPLFRDTKAGVVLVPADLADAPSSALSRIIVNKPHEALMGLLPVFYPARERSAGIKPTVRIGRGAKIGNGVTLDDHVVIGEGASIGDGVWIGSNTVVGDGVQIGAGSELFPNVTVYAGTILGERVRAHSGSVLGSDGFGYVFKGGEHARIPHIGRCIIENDVEVGANTTIDRGSIDDTTIGAGTKIDNLVQVGHNVRIGRLCLIMAQVGIAGSAEIGDGCVLAGQAGIGGHITIGAGAKIAGQAGVFGDVPEGESWSGYPARPHRESLRATGALFKLSGMMKSLEQLLEDKQR
ncbi:MAG TPA: UDP-3-O-(3-hydroxymyristoyl)glucosamine N-acyltransferase [Gemmatimonadaceae bacterium]|jgi:UDP-3-O-[3-hydroxymyristoyl] glucosamine N-acyltransferase|nr:UDP-3-O-(3-hydroxymyristoyl)glucosamine N-acyltransferase [Gemmatimonadaceae bacterium]